MALIIVNPDGSSNAVAGDQVVTGGGIYEKLADGTSKLVSLLPISTGKTGSYSEVQRIYQDMRDAIDGKGVNKDAIPKSDIVVEDTEWNYDNFTVGEDYNFSSGSGSLDMSNIIGYGIVFLVGIVVLDKFMGK